MIDKKSCIYSCDIKIVTGNTPPECQAHYSKMNFKNLQLTKHDVMDEGMVWPFLTLGLIMEFSLEIPTGSWKDQFTWHFGKGGPQNVWPYVFSPLSRV